MVRTQIQLKERQAEMLRRAAAERGVSMAELIRRSVDLFLATKPPVAAWEDRKQRAVEAAGRFRSGLRDLGESHDRYLEEVFGR